MATAFTEADLERWRPLVKHVAGKLIALVPAADFDDLVQDGMIRVWRSPYDGRVPIASWVRHMAYYGMLDGLRAQWGSRRWREQPVSLSTPYEMDPDITLADTLVDPGPSPDERVETRRQLALLHSLPVRESAALIGNAAGISLLELAEVFGVTESRMSQLCTRGRKRLALAA